jgi:hypothetical protein
MTGHRKDAVKKRVTCASKLSSNRILSLLSRIAQTMHDEQGPPQECIICGQYGLRDAFGAWFDDDEPVCNHCQSSPQAGPAWFGPEEVGWGSDEEDRLVVKSFTHDRWADHLADAAWIDVCDGCGTTTCPVICSAYREGRYEGDDGGTYCDWCWEMDEGSQRWLPVDEVCACCGFEWPTVRATEYLDQELVGYDPTGVEAVVSYCSPECMQEYEGWNHEETEWSWWGSGAEAPAAPAALEGGPSSAGASLDDDERAKVNERNTYALHRKFPNHCWRHLWFGILRPCPNRKCNFGDKCRNGSHEQPAELASFAMTLERSR